MGTAMFQCRYAGPPRGQHYEQWREEFGRRWLSADLEPADGDYLANEFHGTEHSFLALCVTRGSPIRMRRRDDISGSALDFCYLILASGSPVHTRQRGRSNELLVGQMALMSAAEPAGVTQLMKGSRWSIRIPHKRLKDVCRDVEDRLARAVTADAELTKLLLHQVETAHRFGSRLDAQANNALAQHILDLSALCLGVDRDATRAAEQRGLAAARLDSIKADILCQLGTPELGLDWLAGRHRVSPRYVQHLFERAGTSFSRFVLEQRLRAAYRRLRDPSNRWRKVSDIAAASGFADVSYFNRAFKARFAVTPRDARALMTELDLVPAPALDDERVFPVSDPG